ncbi:unnamed protein product [Moneuplotes crassus]|uniref:Uncharacterized protein n=1 Tax=Euplotes crassus TaxID=5936 RepID=A0AAD2D4G6_EUPCR|nr:unnamed protein product [Moneuplotes crassus]
MDPKGPLQPKNEPTTIKNGVVESVFKFSKAIFNARKVAEKISQVFPSIMCEEENCFKNGELIEQHKFKCHNHQQEYSNINISVNEAYKAHLKRVNEIEQVFVKVEIMFAFMKSEGVISEISKPDVKSMNDLYEKIVDVLNVAEIKAEGLRKDCRCQDFDFLEDAINKSSKMKDEIHAIFSPYLVSVLENRAFDHLTGNADEKAKESKEEDFSPIFETLIDNEYEFCTLLMHPKLELKDKIKEVIEEKKTKGTKERASILVGLHQSKGLYELQIQHARDENLRLQREKEQCQMKLVQMVKKLEENGVTHCKREDIYSSKGISNVPIKADIDFFLKEMGTDKLIMNGSRTLSGPSVDLKTLINMSIKEEDDEDISSSSHESYYFDEDSEEEPEQDTHKSHNNKKDHDNSNEEQRFTSADASTKGEQDKTSKINKETGKNSQDRRHEEGEKSRCAQEEELPEKEVKKNVTEGNEGNQDNEKLLENGEDTPLQIIKDIPSEEMDKMKSNDKQAQDSREETKNSEETSHSESDSKSSDESDSQIINTTNQVSKTPDSSEKISNKKLTKKEEEDRISFGRDDEKPNTLTIGEHPHIEVPQDLEQIAERPSFQAADYDMFKNTMGLDTKNARVTHETPRFTLNSRFAFDKLKIEKSDIEEQKTFLRLVQKLVNQKYTKFNKTMILSLDITKANHCQFISSCDEQRVPEFKGIYIGYKVNPNKRHDYDKSFIMMHKHKEAKFKIFKRGMRNLLNQSLSHVYLDLFILDNMAMKIVIEGCCNAKKLTLRGCEVHINRSFSVKLSIRYRLEDINLFGTLDYSDENYMNEVKLKIFALVLATTNIRNTLSIARVAENMFPTRIAQQIFNESKFNLEVVGEHKIQRGLE